MSTASGKSELRNRYRFQRRERYLDHSFSYLATSAEFAKVSNIASYISYGEEPSTKELNAALLKSGKNLFLPRINGKKLEWVKWNGIDSDLSPSKFSKKIIEPVGCAISDNSIIELVVVPALRIDRSGYRLGQGGGFYDRALAEMKVWSIGLIHPDEISSEDLPREDFDIPLNAAATPNLLLRFNN
ncbi:MAG: 5-formyltetrahydrofolate cyclo-ligase [Candidatus Planktophila sp.]|nr:5-formyltetrahydrofolate cyclo-ligase [Candidatus Planktophila sp.]